LRALGNELAMLLAEEDVEAIGAALEPGSVAAVLVWESVWAAPFGSAVRRSRGKLVASGRIPIQGARGGDGDGRNLRCRVEVGLAEWVRSEVDRCPLRCGGGHGLGRYPGPGPARGSA
jgi:hypothetical protein